MMQPAESSAQPQQTLAYAHRGARAHAPENTLLAFSLAFALGADAIECDVQRSRDGQLVIIHDGTVDRTTNGKGAVNALSGAELHELNASLLQHVWQSIPTLDETLALVQQQNRRVNLEVKGESAEEALATANAMEPALQSLAEDVRSRILVSSFEHSAIALLKQHLPWLRVAPLFGSEWQDGDVVESAVALEAEAIHPEVSLLTEEMVRQAHAAGLQVNVWTANSWIRIRRLLSWQVDGIFSDYPERVVIARALRRAATHHA